MVSSKLTFVPCLYCRYGQLFEYGMGSGEGAEALVSEDDPDSELVPQLVRKLVLPLALHWIERWVWGWGCGREGRLLAVCRSQFTLAEPGPTQ